MSERRPRWWLRILSGVVVLALLGGAAELALRMIIPGIVGAQVRQALDLSSDHQVETELGGSVALRALTGKVGDVTVRVPDAPVVSGIVADLSAHADSVPFNVAGGEIVGGTARITLSSGQLDPAVALLTRGVAETGEIDQGELVVGRSTDVFGQAIPLTVRLALSVEDGDVLLSPTSVSVVGLSLTAEQISAATGTLLDPILRPEPLCVRSEIPAGITLTDISLSSTGSANIDVALSPRILSDATMRQPGSCS